MSYIKAETILPKELLQLVQEYADGQYLYIPRKASNRKAWGENTDAKRLALQRDVQIYKKYLNGSKVNELAEEFFLSPKSIQRIILKEKRNSSEELRIS